MNKKITKLLPAAIAATIAVGLSAGTNAHTRFEIASLEEGTRMNNNVVVSHGCGENDVVGMSLVAPDGQDSSITVDGVAYEGSLTDFVANWGPNLQGIYSRAVFDQMAAKEDSNDNQVGFWAGGNPLPHHLVGNLPFRVNATNIVEGSCAVSVRFYVSIVDVCQVTGVEGLHLDGVAQFWTHNNLGTVFDRVTETDNGPAPLTITRNLETNPLPPSCGEGVEVEVRPSATQIMRDMPIMFEGVQAWPAP